MKFEKGEKTRKENFRKKSSRGEVGFFDKYIDSNRQEVPELLKKREKEEEELKKREFRKKRKLREAENNGIIFLKDIR